MPQPARWAPARSRSAAPAASSTAPVPFSHHADCDLGVGSYQGDGADCDPNPCTQPGNQGACCDASGSCRVTTLAGCVATEDFYFGNGTDCSPSPCSPSEDYLGIWRYETTLTLCGADSVLNSTVTVDTVCASTYDPTGAGTCSYSVDGDELVSVCVSSYGSEDCTYSFTSIGRLTFGSGTYDVQGRSISVTSGPECLTPGSCYDYSLHATKIGPPPDPCPPVSFEDLRRMLYLTAMKQVKFR